MTVLSLRSRVFLSARNNSVSSTFLTAESFSIFFINFKIRTYFDFLWTLYYLSKNSLCPHSKRFGTFVPKLLVVFLLLFVLHVFLGLELTIEFFLMAGLGRIFLSQSSGLNLWVIDRALSIWKIFAHIGPVRMSLKTSSDRPPISTLPC